MNGLYLVLRESQNRAGKLEMNISNSKSLMRTFWSDFDFCFVSEITRRGPLRVNSSYKSTTSICVGNGSISPVFPRVQVDYSHTLSYCNQSDPLSSNYDHDTTITSNPMPASGTIAGVVGMGTQWFRLC